MKELEKAEMVARWAHGDTKSMDGLPYWTHCQRVALNLKARGYNETIQAIGWLHDVIEDTHLVLQDLDELGFSARVLSGVWAMTQRPEEPLYEYWQRVKENDDARIVKLYGDVVDNDDPERVRRFIANARPPEKAERFAAKLHQKYEDLRKFLDPNFPSHKVDHYTQPVLEL